MSSPLPLVDYEDSEEEVEEEEEEASCGSSVAPAGGEDGALLARSMGGLSMVESGDAEPIDAESIESSVLTAVAPQSARQVLESESESVDGDAGDASRPVDANQRLPLPPTSNSGRKFMKSRRVVLEESDSEDGDRVSSRPTVVSRVGRGEELPPRHRSSPISVRQVMKSNRVVIEESGSDDDGDISSCADVERRISTPDFAVEDSTRDPGVIREKQSMKKNRRIVLEDSDSDVDGRDFTSRAHVENVLPLPLPCTAAADSGEEVVPDTSPSAEPSVRKQIVKSRRTVLDESDTDADADVSDPDPRRPPSTHAGVASAGGSRNVEFSEDSDCVTKSKKKQKQEEEDEGEVANSDDEEGKLCLSIDDDPISDFDGEDEGGEVYTREKSGRDFQRRVTMVGGFDISFNKVSTSFSPRSAWTPGAGEDADTEMWLPARDEEDEPLAIPKELYGKLYTHQQEGIQWMWNRHQSGVGGILGDDMGLGKTIQCSVLLAGLMNTGQIKNALIVAPKSVIRGWEKELNKWLVSEVCENASVVVLTSEISEKRREKIIKSLAKGGPSRQGGICITSYGLISSKPRLFGADGNGVRWNYMILDEGHKIKNPSTQLNKAIHTVPSEHRLLVTGTPIQNNLKELWGLIDWACSGKVLGTHREFIHTYSNIIEAGQDRHASSSVLTQAHDKAQELWLTIAPYLLQRSKSVMDEASALQVNPAQRLPSKTELVAWVNLSQKQREIYSEFLSGSKVNDVLLGATSSPLAAITHLKKICAHPLICAPALQNSGSLPPIPWQLDSSETLESLAAGSAKLRVVVHLIKNLQSDGHRTLVFSQSIRMLDILQRCLDSSGSALRMTRIDGNSSDLERKARIESFNSDPQIDVCLLSTKVGGYGITLTGADRVIVYDPSWNPAEDRQAVDRAYRIGQTRDVVVYRVIAAGTVEEKIYEKQVFKDGLRKSVMNQSAAKPRKTGRYFSRAELRDLFTLGDEGTTRALTTMEEAYGTLENQLEGSECSAQRELVDPSGKHAGMVDSLRQLGLLGMSLHPWEEEEREVESSKGYGGAAHVDGVSRELFAEFPEKEALFSPAPSPRKTAAAAQKDGLEEEEEKASPRRLSFCESGAAAESDKEGEVCSKCIKKSRQAGTVCKTTCKHRASQEVVDFYEYLCRIGRDKEAKSNEEALDCYMDALELIDSDPKLHSKIASLAYAAKNSG